jgi:transglutaminase-like putative cysteine protease
MIYDIRHLTLYEYGSTVTFSHCALRLLPTDGPGQTVLLSELCITPAPAQTIERMCFFGNRLTFLTIETAHRKLIVEVNAGVEIDRSEPWDQSETPAFEMVREEAFASTSFDKDSPAHFLHASRLAPRFEPASDYARESFSAGRPVLEGAKELMRRMKADFKYDTKATVVSTPLSEAFGKRRGVCQDFAHIMIAGLRGIGLPAAYT